MIRTLSVISLLSLIACVPMPDQIRDTKGHPIEYAYVFMQPLCLVFCTTTLATTGTDSDVIGSGSASNSSSTSQTVSPTQTGTVNAGNN